jgi:hypothetical protein
MRWLPRLFAVAALLAFVILSCPPGARADVIVLKNGRRITAANVQEGSDKVSGETAAGTISLSASMVDHIERSKAGENLSTGSELHWDRPSSAGDPGTERPSTVDPARLQQLNREAAGGDSAAVQRAMDVESATGALEFAKGNLGEALKHAERALSYAPDSSKLLLDVAYFHLRRGEFSAALDSLLRARKSAPDSADVAKLTGWAYDGLNQLAPAIEEWKHAQAIHADDDVAAALAKAERDLQAEREFRVDGSEHFELKFDSTSAPEVARGILRQLEADFEDVSKTLNYRPPERIGVLLYTSQAFADITHAPSWVGALNDGRIRIPVQGLSSVTPDLARVLRHELTHSLVGGKTNGRCPTWLQEGVAQWMDGSQITPGGAGHLLVLYNDRQDPSLQMLEGSWLNFDNGLAANAYAWSLAIVEAMAHGGGASDIEHLLQRVATDESTEAAVRNSLGYDYAGLTRFTSDYLHKLSAR